MDLTFRSTRRPQTAAKLNELADRVRIGGYGVTQGPDGVTLGRPRRYIADSFPWGSDHPWGLVSVSGADVTIAAGEFEAGNGSILATSQSVFTLLDDASYIGLQYDPAAAQLTVIGPQTGKPVSGNGVFQTWLYFFSFDGSNARYVRHNLTGNWHAAMFAASTPP